jgi:hypothetical protein
MNLKTYLKTKMINFKNFTVIILIKKHFILGFGPWKVKLARLTIKNENPCAWAW